MINKNYFKYLFKSKIIAWVFFGIMFIAISMSSFLTPGNEAADCFRVTTITSLALSIIMSFALQSSYSPSYIEKEVVICISHFQLIVKNY